MSSTWVAASLVLCACVGSMVRAPKQIPRDGVVECTDSMAAPLEAAAVGAAIIGTALYAAKYHTEWMVDSGAWFWDVSLAGFGVAALLSAPEGVVHARECRDAKRRGAVVAEEARRKAAARAQAGTEWKRAAAAARADDCATVRELDPQIRDLDVELHDVVFMRDVAIARCLGASGAL